MPHPGFFHGGVQGFEGAAAGMRTYCRCRSLLHFYTPFAGGHQGFTGRGLFMLKIATSINFGFGNQFDKDFIWVLGVLVACYLV